MTTTLPHDPSFLAPVGHVADWRLVLLLDAAAETGLLDALPGTPDEVAATAQLSPDAVRRVLDALVAVGACEYRDGTFQELPFDRDVLAMLRHHATMLRRWSLGLPAALRGDEVGGALPQNLDVFLPALGARARTRAAGLVSLCRERFPQARRVLDLGGGHGEDALAFARAGYEVTLQDLPPVIEWLQQRGDAEAAGVRLVTGDLGAELAAGPFGLVLLAGLTHIFPPEEVRSLLVRLRQRVSDDAGLVISSRFRGESPTSALFAVQMLLVGRGGDTHGRDEYDAWLTDAGFSTASELPLGTSATGPGAVLLATAR